MSETLNQTIGITDRLHSMWRFSPRQFLCGNYDPPRSKWRVTQQPLECFWKVGKALSTTSKLTTGERFKNNTVLPVAASNVGMF